LRARFPQDSAAQLRRRLADLWLGPELAAKAYGPLSPINPPQAELFEAVRGVVAVSRDLDIEYFVGGSISSMIFGGPRPTMDADLVARVLGRHAPPLV